MRIFKSMRNCHVKFCFLTLLPFVVLTPCTTEGQASDSSRLKTWNARYKKSERRRDSLETVFNSTPAWFEISWELNHKKSPIPGNAKFYATDGKLIYESKKTDDHKYDFGDLPDSAKFGLRIDSIELETGFIKKKFYKNGAVVRFGYYDNILDLKAQWDKGKKDEGFEEWTEIGEPYLSDLKNKKLMKAAKRKIIKPIEFVSLSPRTFGDGVVHTYQKIKLK
jgi:hypothetical protein